MKKSKKQNQHKTSAAERSYEYKCNLGTHLPQLLLLSTYEYNAIHSQTNKKYINKIENKSLTMKPVFLCAACCIFIAKCKLLITFWCISIYRRRQGQGTGICVCDRPVQINTQFRMHACIEYGVSTNFNHGNDASLTTKNSLIHPSRPTPTVRVNSSYHLI